MTRQGKVNPVVVKADATVYKSIYVTSGTSTPFDDETAIDEIRTTDQPSFFFDLSGRRVSAPQSLRKGIYIKDGKKIIR